MRVRIVEYDPDWPARFEVLAAAIAGALGPVALRIGIIRPDAPDSFF